MFIDGNGGGSFDDSFLGKKLNQNVSLVLRKNKAKLVSFASCDRFNADLPEFAHFFCILQFCTWMNQAFNFEIVSHHKKFLTSLVTTTRLIRSFFFLPLALFRGEYFKSLH